MPNLILIRHAKAVRDHEAPTDKARGLTDRGRANAAALGQRLVDLGLVPDLALVSTAERTRQTWAELRGAFPAPCPTAFVEGLYLAETDRLWAEAVAAMTTAETVALIGHNPGLHELCQQLVGPFTASPEAKQLREHLPTAGLAVFSLSPTPWPPPPARLLAAWYPELARG